MIKGLLMDQVLQLEPVCCKKTEKKVQTKKLVLAIFGRSVNPIRTGGGHVITTYYYCPPPPPIFSPSGVTEVG